MAITPTTNRWLGFHKVNPNSVLRLLCFPYAGGTAAIYRQWATGLPSSVELCAIELPGRGHRLNEEPFTDLRRLVRVASEQLLPLLDRPFAFFGHSMGASISFELAHLLREEQGIEPTHLFISGRRAPQLSHTMSVTYNLPDKEFLAELKNLNGTPSEALENHELMELMMPMLRSDFELIQSYTYRPRSPLNCPITAFGGLQDPEVGREMLEPWREHTNTTFSLLMLNGHHFFFKTARPLLLEAISKRLAGTANRISRFR